MADLLTEEQWPYHSGAAVDRDTVRRTLPDVSRIEGTTRADNRAMRRVFRHCGYGKEAHYRDGWPVAGGGVRDAVGYAILRRDWVAGTVTTPNWDDEDVGMAPHE